MIDNIQACFTLAFADFKLEVDLQLPSKGVTALFGHSGSGKTTLLRCMAGLEYAPHGLLTLKGEVWQDSQQAIFLPTHQRPLGYVFQEANLFPHLTVRQNLEFGRKRSRVVCNADGLAQAVELLGIGHLLTRMPAKLSGGERQRVAIARALAVCPQVLLMDEPLSALDSQRKQEILPFLSRLHRELDLPIFYVTHSSQEVIQLADHLVVLDAGKVVVSGTPAATLTRLDFPLAQGQDAASRLEVEVCGHEPEFHLSQVKFAGGILHLPYQQAAALGTRLRLRVLASDVSLTLQAPTHSSILNVLAATITDIAHDMAGVSMLQLQIADIYLLAQITQKSVRQLGLHKGMSVFAQIKATAIV